MKKVLLIISLLPLLIGATIYKVIDKDGNISFSDSPEQGSEKINLPEPQEYRPPKVPRQPIQQSSTIQPDTQYKVSISTPNNQATIRNNQGNVNIAVDLDPQLKEGDKLVIFLDGAQVSESESVTIFSLTNVDRGEHKLQARVVNTNNKVIASSQSVTIYVHRASSQIPVRGLN